MATKLPFGYQADTPKMTYREADDRAAIAAQVTEKTNEVFSFGVLISAIVIAGVTGGVIASFF